MSRLQTALLLLALAGHAAAQEPASPAIPAASQAPAPAGASGARRVASSPLGACFGRQPAYPARALRNDEQGASLVGFTVSPTGHIEDPGLLRSSGHGLLDQAALAHLNKCIASVTTQPDAALPPGRYALPMVWRIQ
ncbi:energy transducer TonB [Caenimonas terrae]|uniref:Energy transducer TonB n=1 Tax=Caenimonas terrae TaxID=696074 RepID=A0ABW0NF67_9BURK